MSRRHFLHSHAPGAGARKSGASSSSPTSWPGDVSSIGTGALATAGSRHDSQSEHRSGFSLTHAGFPFFIVFCTWMAPRNYPKREHPRPDHKAIKVRHSTRPHHFAKNFTAKSMVYLYRECTGKSALCSLPGLSRTFVPLDLGNWKLRAKNDTENKKILDGFN